MPVVLVALSLVSFFYGFLLFITIVVRSGVKGRCYLSPEQEAVERSSFFEPRRVLERGDVTEAFKTVDRVHSGEEQLRLLKGQSAQNRSVLTCRPLRACPLSHQPTGFPRIRRRFGPSVSTRASSRRDLLSDVALSSLALTRRFPRGPAVLRGAPVRRPGALLHGDPEHAGGPGGRGAGARRLHLLPVADAGPGERRRATHSRPVGGVGGAGGAWPASTHSTVTSQQVVAETLDIPSNRVTCHVKRMGGAFGGKVTKTSILAGITAAAAWK